MLVVLPYCLRDQEITLQLIDWMGSLGSLKPRHTLLLCHDNRCPQEIVKRIYEASRPVFEDVRDIPAKAQIDGWPQGANYMIRVCSTYLAAIRGLKYWLWLEPDAIPLKPNWLDAIEDEYLLNKKPFMGDDVNVEGIPRHMSGIGVYQNPIYTIAGEIYRSHDVAWDMEASHQIIPNAHFTKLIEHAWRHPTFANMDELQTQIRPEAVLFHASKDGSLIKLLRQQRSGADARPSGNGGGEFMSSLEPGSSVGVNPTPLYPPFSHPDAFHAAVSPGPVDARVPQRTYDIFIRTYPVDYQWLQYCLRSITQYARGFRKIWLVSPEKFTGTGVNSLDVVNAEWKVMNEEATDGYLSQQIHKLYADVITNYQPDYILNMDSDTLFTRPVTPQDFFSGKITPGEPSKLTEKLIWYYTPYENTDTPWKPITEKFMGTEVKYEFMRRHPMIVPRWLYDELRKFCFGKHNMLLGDYIRHQPYREFSEFNALGAYAWEFFHDRFNWINTTEVEMPPPFVRQFYSWSGLTDEVKDEIQTILGGTGEQPTPGGALAPVPAQFNGADDETPGDHVRWLEAYIKDSPSRRQYVMTQLKKARLTPLRKVKTKP